MSLVLYFKFFKRSGLIGLLLLFSSFLIAQENTYFNRWYSHFTGYNSFNEGGVIIVDTNYLMVSYLITPELKYAIGTLVISPSGEVIDSIVISENGYVYLTGGRRELRNLSSSSSIYCGARRNENIPYDYDIHLAKLDNIGDTVWSKVILDASKDESGQAISYFGKKSLYMVSSSSLLTPDSFLLSKLDTNGVFLWEKTMPGLGALSIEKGKEDSIIYIGAYCQLSAQNTDAKIIKLDTMGAIIWEKNVGGAGMEKPQFVIPYFDGGVISIGDSVLYESDDVRKLYAVRFNKDGNRVWTKDYYALDYPFNWFSSGVLNEDSTIVACGNAVLNYYSGSRIMGLLMKIDAENGGNLWTRTLYSCDTVPSASAEHRLTDVIKCSDGGYLVTGWSNNFAACHGQETWVVKTNCLGFDEPPFANFYVNNLSHTYLSATFKNASTHCDEVIWNFGDGSSEIKVKTTDADWTPTHIFPDEGSYTIKMTAFACGDTMEFERTIVLDKALGSSELGVMNDELVFPNPFTDNLNFVGMEVGNEIEVRDVVGRVIYRRKMESSKVELNTTEWNNGIYFVIITKGEQRSRGVYVKQ